MSASVERKIISRARGTRDALDQRNIITTYTKAFFDNYLLKQATDLDSLTFDGVEMIKKP